MWFAVVHLGHGAKREKKNSPIANHTNGAAERKKEITLEVAVQQGLDAFVRPKEKKKSREKPARRII